MISYQGDTRSFHRSGHLEGEVAKSHGLIPRFVQNPKSLKRPLPPARRRKNESNTVIKPEQTDSAGARRLSLCSPIRGAPQVSRVSAELVSVGIWFDLHLVELVEGPADVRLADAFNFTMSEIELDRAAV